MNLIKHLHMGIFDTLFDQKFSQPPEVGVSQWRNIQTDQRTMELYH